MEGDPRQNERTTTNMKTTMTKCQRKGRTLRECKLVAVQAKKWKMGSSSGRIDWE